jgi:Domain of unknown function (DUF4349)
MRLRRDVTLDPAIARELAALDAALAGEPVDPDLLELEALVRDARDIRPAPSAEFAARLDDRAAAGFPAPDGGRTPLSERLRPSRRMLLPAMGAAASVVLLVGVGVAVLGGSGGRTSSLKDASLTRQAAPRTGAAPSESVAPAAPTAAAQGAGRRVERHANLVLTAPSDRIDDVSQQVIAVTDGVGGIVGSSSVSSGDGGQGGATFTLKIPASKLSTALSQLSKLAHVRSRTETGDDITDTFNSSRARLARALAERQSLLRQLANATTPTQAESIRVRLRINDQAIGQARAALKDVRARANYATVQLSVEPRGSAGGAGAGWTPDDALGDARRILEISLGVLVVGAAALVPLGALGLAAGFGARAVRRRRREQALA